MPDYKSGFEQRVVELKPGTANETLDDFSTQSANYQQDNSTKECTRQNIVSFGGWPETKTEWETECTPPPIRICTDVPKLYRRNCNYVLYAEACYPKDVKKDVEECLTTAVIAAAAAFAAGGGIAGAKAAFKTSFEACILAKLKERAKEVSFKLDRDTKCGRWIPV